MHVIPLADVIQQVSNKYLVYKSYCNARAKGVCGSDSKNYKGLGRTLRSGSVDSGLPVRIRRAGGFISIVNYFKFH